MRRTRRPTARLQGAPPVHAVRGKGGPKRGQAARARDAPSKRAHEAMRCDARRASLCASDGRDACGRIGSVVDAVACVRSVWGGRSLEARRGDQALHAHIEEQKRMARQSAAVPSHHK
eukprot:7391171-Prymnesium_polylepis.2